MTVTAERRSCASVDEVGALLPVVGGSTTVPLVDGSQRVYANLDYAASAPALEAVAARVTEVLPLYASVHRGAGYLSQVSTALYESARQTVARFVDARPDDVAIITRNTTDSLNLLAGVRPGRRTRARAGRRAPRQPAALGADERAARQPHDDPAHREHRRGDPRRAADRARAPAVRAGHDHGRVQRDGGGAADRPGRRARPRRGRPGGRRRRPARPAPRLLPDGDRRRLRRVLGPQDLRPVRCGRPRRAPRLARHGHAVPRRRRCGARRACRPDRLAARTRPARGRVAQRDRRDRPRRGVRPARRAAGRCAGGARGGAARAARRGPVGDRRRRDRAHLAGLPAARRRADVHGARPRSRAWSRRTSPPSTASASATAGSARTRSWRTWARPAARSARRWASARRARRSTAWSSRSRSTCPRVPRSGTRSSTAAGRSSRTPAPCSPSTAWTTWRPRPPPPAVLRWTTDRARRRPAR